MAKKKKKKIDVHSDGPSLPDDRFAALASLFDDEESPLVEKHEAAEINHVTEENTPWTVEKTRKGNYDIRLEKRGGGKTVTVLARVSGDVKKLLKEMKKLCAGGGAIKGDSIEIQGDHRNKIIEYLTKNG